MNKHTTPKEYISQIENDFLVNTITANNISIWPILRPVYFEASIKKVFQFHPMPYKKNILKRFSNSFFNKNWNINNNIFNYKNLLFTDIQEFKLNSENQFVDKIVTILIIVTLSGF